MSPANALLIDTLQNTMTAAISAPSSSLIPFSLLAQSSGGVGLPLVLGLLLLAVLLTAVVVVLFVLFLKARDRRRAKQAEADIRGNADASQAGMTADEASKANEFAAKFKEGMTEFNRHGKSIYDLPWYAIIGEPASGKTKALQKSGLKFPSFMLEKGLPGTGGTINMDWFFTEQAVILDTAGRLTTERVEATATGPWKQFLAQLKRNRPLCPLNGVIVVIPADKLGIQDTVRASVFEQGRSVEKTMPIAEYIEYMGPKLGQRLEQMQRDLGVRLAVFVIVTKCDLIHGFREFFEGYTDIAAQEQIFGWSHEAQALDTPFAPATLEGSLKSLYERLRRRRLGLLLDPINTADPNASRLDQVDSLFNFPSSMKALEPRLKRYMELILPSNAWATKAPFFRGIYFTSSVQEGEAIDTAYREMVGHAPPASQAATVERALFLPDLFTKKVIPEQGLVTNADNTRSLRRKRKVILASAASIGLLLLLGLTFWGQYTLRANVAGHADVFRDVASKFFGPQRYPLIDLDKQGNVNGYSGATLLEFGDDKAAPVSAIPLRVWDKVQQPIYIPVIFRFRSFSSDLLVTQRRKAYTNLIESFVLDTLLTAAPARLASPAPDATWSPDATATLASLIKLETLVAAKPGSAPLGDALSKPVIDLDPVARLVLTAKPKQTEGRKRASKDTESDERIKAFNEDQKRKELALALTLGQVYPDGKPSEWLRATVDINRSKVDTAVDRFIAGWKQLNSGQGLIGQLKGFSSLLASQQKLIDEFKASAAELHKLTAKPLPRTAEESERLRVDAEKLLKDLTTSREQIDAIEKEIAQAWDKLAGPGRTRNIAGVSEVLDQAVKQATSERDEAFNRLLEPEVLLAKGEENPDAAHIVSVFAKLRSSQERGRKDLEQSLAGLRSGLETVVAARQTEPAESFAQRHNVYRVGVAQLAPPPSEPRTVAQTIEAIKAFDAVVALPAEVKESVDRGATDKEAQDTLRKSYSYLDAAGRGARIAALVVELLTPLRDRDKLSKAIEELTTAQTAIPAVPRSDRFSDGGKFEKATDPKSLDTLLSAVNSVRDRLVAGASPAAPLVVPDGDRLSKEIAQWQKFFLTDYGPQCVAAWRDIRRGASPTPNVPWSEFPDRAGKITVATISNINRSLRTLDESLIAAVSSIKALGPSDEADKLADELKKELATLADPEFARACARAVNAFAGLDKSPSAARAQLAPIKAADFAIDYLAAYRDVPDGPVMYWNEFTMTGLASLGKACTEDANRAWNDLVTRAKRPPIYIADNTDKPLKALTIQEVKELSELITKLAGAVAAGGTGSSDKSTLGQGDRRMVPDKKIQEHLAAVFAANLRQGKQDRDWIARLDVSLRALAQPRRCAIEYDADQTGSAVPGTVPNNDRYRYMEMLIGDAGGKLNAVGQPVQMDRGPAFNAAGLRQDDIGARGRAVQFSFFADAQRNQPVGSTAIFEADWGLLNALSLVGAKAPEQAGAGWKVPLIIRDAADPKGPQYLYYVRLKFTPEITGSQLWFDQRAGDFWPAQ